MNHSEKLIVEILRALVCQGRCSRPALVNLIRAIESGEYLREVPRRRMNRPTLPLDTVTVPGVEEYS